MMRFFTQICLFLLASLLPISGWAQTCTASFTENRGLFTISSNSKVIVNTDFIFWGKDWAWAGTGTETKTQKPLSYLLDAEVDKLGLSIDANITVSDPNQIYWDFKLNALRDQADIIGGGIQFNLEIDGLNEVENGPRVDLLPDNTGWMLSNFEDCDPISIRFDRPIANIYFERNNPRQIRAFFYEKTITAGSEEYQMSVSLPFDGKIEPTLTEKMGAPPDLTWTKDILHWAYSPVDLSFLNAKEIPAGKRGFMKTDGESLVFEDGTKVKFWGTNIIAYAIFLTSPSEITNQAKRLSKLGYNLVRFHHHDSAWVSPNVFGGNSADTLTLDEDQLDMLDRWIVALKNEGIYIWLDLNVGREFSANDNIENFDEFSKGKERAPARGYNYINKSVETRLKEFNEQYLNHVNKYTGLAYKDDPAIVSMLITNENDITHHFANNFLPNRNVPKTNAVYMDKSKRFALRHGLPVDKTWRSWEPGPAKLFLNEMEHEFNLTMLDHLDELGVKSTIMTTNSWGYMPIYSLPALSDSDIIDVHTYGGTDFLRMNPIYKDNFVSWIGAAQANGKPVSVSEWNLEPFPVYDRFLSPVYLAAVSALQGWDSLMQYGYSQRPIKAQSKSNNYSSFNDPAAMSMMPAAALIYRQGHVAEAKKTYALTLNKEEFFYKNISPANSAALRTIVDQSKLIIDIPKTSELPWFEPIPLADDVIKITDANSNLIPEGQDFVTSDTGELNRNWGLGIYTINTPKSQVVMGWIGDREISLDNITVTMENNNSIVAVQSLDETEIAGSEKILISFATRSDPSEGNMPPFLSEPLKGKLQVVAKEGLKLYVLNKYGKEFDLPFIYSNGRYQFSLDKNIKSYWLMLKK
tara:strand:+ start:278312 stop:280900 length:2589 start_codon:yes stop_codon:yes gene_type:complete